MVFKLVKKMFSDAPVDQLPVNGSNGHTTHVTEEATEGALNLPKMSGNAEMETLAQEKWMELLHTFVHCWSNKLAKVQVIELLKEQLNQKGKLEFKESSSNVGSGHAVTLIEISDLAMFNGSGLNTTSSRVDAMSNVYDFLIHYRDMISIFKKAFYLSQYDKKLIIKALTEKNFKMVQQTSSVDGGFFTCTITLTNMAKFTETATTAEAAFMSVSHQACEYLRKIAQVGSNEIENIFSNGSSKISTGPVQNVFQVGLKLAVKPEVKSDLPGQQVEGVNKPVTQPQTNAVFSSFEKSKDVKITTSDLSLVEKWSQLMKQYSSVSYDGKSKWQTRRQLEIKGHIIYVRSTLKTAFNNEKIYCGIAELKGLGLELEKKGQSEAEAKDQVLLALFRLLNNFQFLLKDFKRYYSPDKSANSVFESLQRKYHMMIQIKVEKLKTPSSDAQFEAKVELKHIAWFKALADNREVAEDAVFQSFVDFLLKVSKWKSKTESVNNKLAPVQTNGTNGSSLDITDKNENVPECEKKDVLKSKYQLTKMETNQTLPTPKAPPVQVVEKTQKTDLPAELSKVDKVKTVYFVPIDMLILLIARFVKVNTPDKKMFQVMQDLRNEGQWVYFSWKSVPVVNNGCSQPQKFREVINKINLNFLRFKVSIEDLIARKPDALFEAFNFLNNLSNLITDFKKSVNISKCAVELLFLLKTRNPEMVNNVTKPNSGFFEILVNFTNLSTFTSKDANCLVAKHRVCLEALKYLAKLADITLDHFSAEQETECVCFNGTLTNGSNVTKNYQIVGKNQTPKIPNQPAFDCKIPTQQLQKLNLLTSSKETPKSNGSFNLKPNEVTCNETHAKNFSQSSFQQNAKVNGTHLQLSLPKETVNEQQSSTTVAPVFSSQAVLTENEIEAKKLIPELIQLINRYNNAVKNSDSEWTTLNKMQLDGQKIRNSLEFTGVNEDRVYTYTVTLENLGKNFIFTSTSKDATICSNETIKIVIDCLSDLRDLLFNFNKLHSPNANSSKLIKNLKKNLQNKQILKMSPISRSTSGPNNKLTYSCSIILEKLATFVGFGETVVLSEEDAAKKAVDYLLELLQTNIINN